MLYGAVLETLARDPDRVAIVSESGRRSYGELHVEVECLVAGLAAMGVGTRDVVATFFPNDFETYVAIVALARLGVVNVPMWLDLPADELSGALQRAGATQVLAAHDFASGLVGQVDGRRVLDYRELVERARADRLAIPPHREQRGLFFLLETSGSTGIPKLVMFSQERYMSANGNWLRAVGLTSDDVTLCVFPPNIGHGLLLTAGALLSGGQVVLGDPAWTPSQILTALQEHRATVFSGLPLHYDMLCAAAGEDSNVRLADLRRAFCGGAYLPPSTIEDAYRFLGVEIKRLYGTTEFGVILGNLDDGLQTESGMLPLGDVEVRLLDSHGDEVHETLGEVVARHDGTSLGYLGDEAATAELFRDGWCHTGDLGYRDADGALWVVGRRSDALEIAGGYVFAAELEAAVRDGSAIDEAVVLVGSNGDEGLEVFIVAGEDGDVEHARDVLATRGLSGRVHARCEIPRLGSGKPDRASLLRSLAVEDVAT